jgi:hypothetical protein
MIIAFVKESLGQENETGAAGHDHTAASAMTTASRYRSHDAGLLCASTLLGKGYTLCSDVSDAMFGIGCSP